MSEKKTICIYENSCSGCPDIAAPYNEVLEKKKNVFLEHLENSANIEVSNLKIIQREFKNPSIRCRSDLTLISEKGIPTLGFYSNSQETILDIESCSALLPQLNEGLKKFRENLPAIRKGSLRLRVSPSGKLGIWLDFSNTDIQYLLEQEEWLHYLMSHFYVEIGQRRKKLVNKDGKLKLEKESLFPWYETYSKGKSFNLHSQVASFTQPSFITNKTMIESIESLSEGLNNQTCIEVGAGIGNFSIPLSFLFENLVCLENDKWSLNSLTYNLKKHEIKAEIKKFDFKTKLKNFKLNTKEWALFLDPPRSGVGDIITNLGMPQLPSHILYVSCFPESFAQDCSFFSNHGYSLEELHLIDQFPFTKHLEVIGKLRLN